jgi:hypothetical protein
MGLVRSVAVGDAGLGDRCAGRPRPRYGTCGRCRGPWRTPGGAVPGDVERRDEDGARTGTGDGFGAGGEPGRPPHAASHPPLTAEELAALGVARRVCERLAGETEALLRAGDAGQFDLDEDARDALLLARRDLGRVARVCADAPSWAARWRSLRGR